MGTAHELAMTFKAIVLALGTGFIVLFGGLFWLAAKIGDLPDAVAALVTVAALVALTKYYAEATRDD